MSMSITERTLRKWRGEALRARKRLIPSIDGGQESKLEYVDRVLRMTQELLDQHLLRKETGK